MSSPSAFGQFETLDKTHFALVRHTREGGNPATLFGQNLPLHAVGGLKPALQQLEFRKAGFNQPHRPLWQKRIGSFDTVTSGSVVESWIYVAAME